MRVLGVICHSSASVRQHLTETKRNFTSYPDVSGQIVIAVTVEQLLLVMKKAKDQNLNPKILCLDMPTHLNGLHIEMVGAQPQPMGLYFRVPLQVPKEFPEFVLDKKLRAVGLTIKNVKRYVAKKAST